jgi:hypothetical protein
MAGAGAAARAAAKAAGGQTGVGKLISGLGGVGGLVSIGSSLAGLLGGIGQKRKAKKMLAEAIDPGLKAYEENAAKAEQLARQGLPAQEYNLASTNIQRGTQAGLRQLSRMSNPFAGISGLARSQSDAFSKLDASNAAARRQNIVGAMQAKRDLNNMQLQRYNDEINQANALLGAGQQNVAGALGSLGQFGLMQSLYGGGNKGGNRNPSNNPLPAGGISTGGFNAWQLPGVMGGSALPGNNLSGLGRRRG